MIPKSGYRFSDLDHAHLEGTSLVQQSWTRLYGNARNCLIALANKAMAASRSKARANSA
jgi:hypothetical protein